MKVLLAVLGTFLGCCSNVVILEYMIKYVELYSTNLSSKHKQNLVNFSDGFLFCFRRLDPGSGNLVTFAQFLFIAIEGFIFTAKFGREPLRIGYSTYIVLVAMFFVASVLNNYAFDFNIPMPLHMIFRAVSAYL